LSKWNTFCEAGIAMMPKIAGLPRRLILREGHMRPREPSQINTLQQYRPPCSICGAPMSLACIDPAPEEDYDHDLRTYRCKMCGRSDLIDVELR
jgi:hypothetical protein